MRRFIPALALGACILSVPVAVSTVAVDDWPQWRGANRDGISSERGLLQAWPRGGPPHAWRARGAGEGYSSFAVAGDTLYTMGARGGDEFVTAFGASDGKKRWETRLGRRFDNDRGGGPRGTPTVDGDRLYAYSASGDLAALDRASGKILWSVNLLQRFGGSNITWGLSESPLVLEDRILAAAGGRKGSIVALRKSDGETLWQAGSDRAGYSSAVVHEVGGIRQAIFFTASQATGVNVVDGRVLWNYDRVANRTANIATPIVRGNRVFLSSDYGTGAALLEMTARGNDVTAREVYFTREMRNHHASSVLIGDHLYGFSAAILTAMHFDTGKVAWRDRSVGKGSVIAADNRLYLFSEQGVVGLVEPTPDGYREHGRFTIEIGRWPTWSHPVVAGGRLFLRDQDTIYAYDVRARSGGD
jgi:outer membrane protein assembly factor BamB